MKMTSPDAYVRGDRIGVRSVVGDHYACRSSCREANLQGTTSFSSMRRVRLSRDGAALEDFRLSLSETISTR